MKFFSLVAGLAAVAGMALASPAADGGWSSSASCLSDADARTVANSYGDLIRNYSKTAADALLLPTFHEQSDSLNTLFDNGTQSPVPMGAPSFTSRANFESMQGAQPAIPFTILNVWHSCNATIFRWRSTLTPQQVQGITYLGVRRSSARDGANLPKYRVAEAYVEFNSAAWLRDLGQPECQKSSSSS